MSESESIFCAFTGGGFPHTYTDVAHRRKRIISPSRRKRNLHYFSSLSFSVRLGNAKMTEERKVEKERKKKAPLLFLRRRLYYFSLSLFLDLRPSVRPPSFTTQSLFGDGRRETSEGRRHKKIFLHKKAPRRNFPLIDGQTTFDLFAE